MKRFIGVLLAAVLIFAGGAVSVFADTTGEGEGQILKINISNICTLLWAGEKPQFSAEIDPDVLSKINVEEKWIGLNELTVSGDNIALENGTYRYELKLSTKEGFSFSNDLKVYYQGIDGRYEMKYTFPPGEDANHTMIVTGDFDNIIAASPLKIDVGKLLAYILSGDYSKAVDFILDEGLHFSDNVSVEGVYPVSDDKYSYELVLKTKEGFHFCNKLDFIYDGEKYGYTIDYDYDLLEKNHKLIIRVGDEKKTEPEPAEPATDLRPGTGAEDADRIIRKSAGESDPKGTVYSKLKLRSKYQTNNAIKLNWQKLSKAKMYVIYGNKCGSSTKPKRIAVTTGNAMTIKSISGKNLKKGTYYKFIIVALDKNGKVVSTSRLIHVATKGGKAGNHKSVTVSKSIITKAQKLKKGKTLKLNARAVALSTKQPVKKHAALRYESTNKSIATVSKNGTVTAKKKGTCYIFAYAQNGIFRKIKVVVR